MSKTSASVIYLKNLYDDRKTKKSNYHYLIKFDKDYLELLEKLQQQLSFKKNCSISKKMIIQLALLKLSQHDHLDQVKLELLEYANSLPKAVRKRKIKK